MKLNKINHIAIIVSDYNRSKKFYSEILGLKIIDEIFRHERQSNICYLELGQTIIELFSFPNPPERPSYPEALGLRHLAFSISNFDAFIEYLNGFNIKVEPIRIDERTGKRMTFFPDPDNLPLELCEI